MLWEVEIEGKMHDPERDRVVAEFELLTHNSAAGLLERTARGFLLEGELDQEAAQRIVDELLLDPLVESAHLACVPGPPNGNTASWTVLLKPGVMDPVAQSVVDAARDLGIDLQGVRTFRRYGPGSGCDAMSRTILRKILANDAVEQLVEGPLTLDHLTVSHVYRFQRVRRAASVTRTIRRC